MMWDLDSMGRQEFLDKKTSVLDEVYQLASGFIWHLARESRVG